MARAASLALLLAMSALPGCEIVDLQAPEPTVTTGAVSVVIAEADSFVLQLDVWMNTGIRDRGRARQLSNPALLVNGQPLLPHRFVTPDDYYYQTRLGAAAAGERVVVRLPVVDGYIPAPIDVNVPVLRRAGPNTLQLAGGDLVLTMAPGPIQSVPLPIRSLIVRDYFAMN